MRLTCAIHPIAKFYNRLCSNYDTFSVKSDSSIVKTSDLEREIKLLTGKWCESPLTNESQTKLVKQQQNVVERYLTALNDKESCFSPFGKFINSETLKKNQQNRFYHFLLRFYNCI